MPYPRLSVALSESDSLVWACEASVYCEYFCANCGASLKLDVLQDCFKHPANAAPCSIVQSHQKFGLLCLQQALRNAGARIQLARMCKNCGANNLHDISGQFQTVFADDGTEALLIEAFQTLLFLMRPSSPAARSCAAQYAAYWVEVDARNIISGTPLAMLDSNLPFGTCAGCCLGQIAKEVK
jgi:hypothetical protein